MVKIYSIIRQITEKTLIPSAIFLLGMMLLIVIKVFSRKVGISSIPGSYEIFEMMAVVVTSTSISYALAKGSIIFVDILTSHLPKLGRLICKAIGSIIGIILWALIGYATILYIQIKQGMAEMTPVLEVPYMPFRIVWLLGVIIYWFAIFMDLRKEIKYGEAK